jgi:hypothetical protein
MAQSWAVKDPQALMNFHIKRMIKAMQFADGAEANCQRGEGFIALMNAAMK